MICSCTNKQEIIDDSLLKCDNEEEQCVLTEQNYLYGDALMTTRFKSLDDLKKIVTFNYYGDSAAIKNDTNAYSKVVLSYCHNQLKINSILESGVDQGDILKAQRGDLLDKIALVFNSPYAIYHHEELAQIFLLARRRNDLFGAGDAAFYDLAEVMVHNIIEIDSNNVIKTDTTSKGYINTFNHITAQALITSIFSEEMADYIADLHERHHLPELTTGKFTSAQLNDFNNSPLDNYVDMINNEWGQELGKFLKNKYNITSDTKWTNQLLANYLNDIQEYFSNCLHVKMEKIKVKEPEIERFIYKIEPILKGQYSTEKL